MAVHYLSTHFIVRAFLSDLFLPEVAIVENKTRIGCAAECLSRPSCKSIFYNDEQQACYPTDRIFTSKRQLLYNNGFKYYVKSFSTTLVNVGIQESETNNDPVIVQQERSTTHFDKHSLNYVDKRTTNKITKNFEYSQSIQPTTTRSTGAVQLNNIRSSTPSKTTLQNPQTHSHTTDGGITVGKTRDNIKQQTVAALFSEKDGVIKKRKTIIQDGSSAGGGHNLDMEWSDHHSRAQFELDEFATDTPLTGGERRGHKKPIHRKQHSVTASPARKMAATNKGTRAYTRRYGANRDTHAHTRRYDASPKSDLVTNIHGERLNHSSGSGSMYTKLIERTRRLTSGPKGNRAMTRSVQSFRGNEKDKRRDIGYSKTPLPYRKHFRKTTRRDVKKNTGPRPAKSITVYPFTPLTRNTFVRRRKDAINPKKSIPQQASPKPIHRSRKQHLTKVKPGMTNTADTYKKSKKHNEKKLKHGSNKDKSRKINNKAGLRSKTEKKSVKPDSRLHNQIYHHKPGSRKTRTVPPKPHAHPYTKSRRNLPTGKTRTQIKSVKADSVVKNRRHGASSTKSSKTMPRYRPTSISKRRPDTNPHMSRSSQHRTSRTRKSNEPHSGRGHKNTRLNRNPNVLKQNSRSKQHKSPLSVHRSLQKSGGKSYPSSAGSTYKKPSVPRQTFRTQPHESPSAAHGGKGRHGRGGLHIAGQKSGSKPNKPQPTVNRRQVGRNPSVPKGSFGTHPNKSPSAAHGRKRHHGRGRLHIAGQKSGGNSYPRSAGSTYKKPSIPRQHRTQPHESPSAAHGRKRHHGRGGHYMPGQNSGSKPYKPQPTVNRRQVGRNPSVPKQISGRMQSVGNHQPSRNSQSMSRQRVGGNPYPLSRAGFNAQHSGKGKMSYQRGSDRCAVSGYSYEPRGGFCYKDHTSERMYWTPARDICTREGGKLFMVNRHPKHVFMVDQGKKHNGAHMWIGAFKKFDPSFRRNEFEWQDNKGFTLTQHWCRPGPDRNLLHSCVQYCMCTGQYLWSNLGCQDAKLGFFCEGPLK